MMRWLRLFAVLAIGFAVAACAGNARDGESQHEAEPGRRASAKATDLGRLQSIYCLNIEGSGVQHYITGSVHFPLFFRLDVAPEILALVERSDVLLLEATLPPIREELLESERLRKRLGELEPPIADKVLEQIDQQLGRDRRISREAWLRLNPIEINQGLESQIGFPRPRGSSLDAQFVAAARRGDNDIDGIEQMLEQVMFVNQVPTLLWEKIFLDQLAAIRSKSRREQLLESLRAQYATIGNAQWDQFDAVVRSQDHYLSMLTLAMSDVRNQTLAARIIDRLRVDHRSHFIALGAARLGGEQGVLSRLRANGALLEKDCEAAVASK